MYNLIVKAIINENRIELWHTIQDDYFEVWINGKLDMYFCNIDKAFIHFAKKIKEKINEM